MVLFELLFLNLMFF